MLPVLTAAASVVVMTRAGHDAQAAASGQRPFDEAAAHFNAGGDSPSARVGLRGRVIEGPASFAEPFAPQAYSLAPVQLDDQSAELVLPVSGRVVEHGRPGGADGARPRPVKAYEFKVASAAPQPRALHASLPVYSPHLAPQAAPLALPMSLPASTPRAAPRASRALQDWSSEPALSFGAAKPALQLGEMHIVRASGAIQGTFYASAVRAGAPGEIVAQAVEVLAHQIDFQRDVRAGDRFELLFERPSGSRASREPRLFMVAFVGEAGARRYFLHEKNGAADYFDEEGRSARSAFLRTPVEAAWISSHYGMRTHPILGFSRMHAGVDFAAQEGTTVKAAGDGEVVEAGWNGDYGNYIRIRHQDGYETAYAHLSAMHVEVGDLVLQGERIGEVGSTGLSTGPHLHYELLHNGRHLNPLSATGKTIAPLDGQQLVAFQRQVSQFEMLAAAAPPASDEPVFMAVSLEFDHALSRPRDLVPG